MLAGYLILSVTLGIYIIWQNMEIFGRVTDITRPWNERVAALVVGIGLLLFSPFVVLYALLTNKQ